MRKTEPTLSRQLLIGAVFFALPLTIIGAALAAWFDPGAANMAAGCGILTLMMIFGALASYMSGD